MTTTVPILTEDLQAMIKGGEFTFCSRCGENVHIGDKEFMCAMCKRRLFGGESSNKKEVHLWDRYESRISSVIREYRMKLAELRLAAQGE